MNDLIYINNIMSLLPHRYPLLLIDRVLEYKVFQYLVAIKNVSINEIFFIGHFPKNAIMPGVLILESLAQAGGILSSLSNLPRKGYKFLYLFSSINNVKFRNTVIPGDQLYLKVSIIKRRKNFWKIYGESLVNNKIVCSADFMCFAKEVEIDK
ncbi:3-hydroxyacyl-[acyl-carrier-protein] dehydratase FabZ [Candidatus Legionella polyplacis]|uniref:3-hydroxyacyl-[acyl-carrier-protein] dehydratase FabZ n=1 Tax=Candidatus Legionella polyplacis TaxID=2005262 RepID=A0ABZ2GVE3_9GAMM|nr:3-hydroxyacyl-ACP dehydratase FabZ [Candidatus Legionella polyplacis]ATW02091.1 3-hydroxyacyl-[acyl-carrier-protein] dehydratase FabZ [Candidatus Legionella polyplacis]